MSTDDKNADVKQMLIELKAYIDQLNLALEGNIHKEMGKNKKDYEEILTLAGELNDFLTR